jgi:error-prone DNA polymerase
MPVGEEVLNDYRFLRLSLRAHPAQFLRDDLRAHGILPNEVLRSVKPDTDVSISGLVTCRQQPGSAKGVIFLTIEDESAVANVIIWPQVLKRVRPIVLGARYVAVHGRVQKEAEVIHVVADTLEDFTPLLARLTGHDFDADPATRVAREDRRTILPREMPQFAADLDVHAHGSAHVPTRRAG